MVPAGSAPLSPQSPSLKRLFRPSPNSTLSDHPPPSPPPPYSKKTRHLPNLSDCHSCGRHVTSPTTPLQPLPSLWRIVLLCNPCLIRVRSAESCSYCLSPAAATSADSYRCPVCRCRVHIDCAVRYGSSPPWSLCTDIESSELGFTICIDCWVPKSLAVSDRVCRKRRPEGGDVKKSENRVSREKNKIVWGDRGKEKVVVRNRALEILDWKMKSAKNKREGERNVLSMRSRSKGSGLDDAELAIRLHRAMNSSPRISRKFLLGSSSGLNASVVKVDNGDLSVMRPNGRFGISYKRRGSDSVDSTCSGRSVSVASSEEGNSKREFLVYRRKCKACDECRVKDEVVSENSTMVFENRNLLVYRRKSKQCDECQIKDDVSRDGGMVLEDQKCHPQDLLVYKRKCKTFDKWQVKKDEVISKKNMTLENKSCHTQDLLVYARKFKKEDESQENAEGVPENSMYFVNRSFSTNDKVDNKLSVDSDKNQSHFECNGICNVKKENPDRYLLKFRKGYTRLKAVTNALSLVLRDAESGKEVMELDQSSLDRS